jgi:hypothetical protein
MLFIEFNKDPDVNDDCLAYFSSLNDVGSPSSYDSIIVGFWLGPDQNRQTVMAPYILCKRELSSNELFHIASNALLKTKAPKPKNDTVVSKNEA